MKTKLIPTWIVVTDAAKAQFYALRRGDAGRRMEETAPAMISHLKRHAADLKSDRPGRNFSAGGVRHAVEPHHDYHKLEKHDFAKAVTAFLEKSFDAHEFERLVLVAPERNLGELRKLLPRKMHKHVWREIARDFTKLGETELWARIAPLLKEHVRAAED